MAFIFKQIKDPLSIKSHYLFSNIYITKILIMFVFLKSSEIIDKEGFHFQTLSSHYC